MIDEVDKVGADYRGDPTSALCWRCWTRSRTTAFSDHYLNLPFDLSKVMFITTCQYREDTIPSSPFWTAWS